MRKVTRLALPSQTQKALQRRQTTFDLAHALGALIEGEWRSARRTKALRTVVATLKTMAGTRERCMYCCDSHGTDIDHFWPKSVCPGRMFQWLNMLLACTECGRFKASTFPIVDGVPQLIDPTAEDPWAHLDFDPDTGVVVARYDVALDAEDARGVATVRVLQLDRREALNDGYLKTWRRLAAVVAAALRNRAPDAASLTAALREADDHGLLGWCFRGTGQNVSPFAELRARHDEVWDACTQTLG